MRLDADEGSVGRARWTAVIENCVVREGGVEPPRPFGHTDLNRARLPIPPLAQHPDGRGSAAGHHIHRPIDETSTQPDQRLAALGCREVSSVPSIRSAHLRAPNHVPAPP